MRHVAIALGLASLLFAGPTRAYEGDLESVSVTVTNEEEEDCEALRLWLAIFGITVECEEPDDVIPDGPD